MTDPVKEQLSACLDGELSEGELDLLLKQVSRDPQLRTSLGRYALIGETLRAKGPIAAPADFSKRIAAAIAAEPAAAIEQPAIASPARKVNPAAVRWLRPAAGVAVAAGVAALAIFTLQEPQPAQPTTYVADAASTASPSSTDAASYIVPASTDSSAFVPAARLTNYVVAHSEYSSPLGRRSVLSGVLAEEETSDSMDVDDASDSIEPAAETQP
jgi:sigma-E factor negative regulatory protein RseA